MLRICNLSSGSKGNLTCIESEKTTILVDIGLSCRETEKRLALLGKTGKDISAVFITHEHTDHMCGVVNFVRKFRCKIFVHIDGLYALKDKCGNLPTEYFSVFQDNGFSFEDIQVTPLRLCHDSVCCSGYIFQVNNQKVAMVTDTGMLTEDVLEKMQGAKLIYLEANHCPDMLRANPRYPAHIKRRILSNKGHLSNQQCAEAISALVQGGTRQFVLSHLSEENNSPEFAFGFICDALASKGLMEGEHFFLDIATQKPGRIYKLVEQR